MTRKAAAEGGAGCGAGGIAKGRRALREERASGGCGRRTREEKKTHPTKAAAAASSSERGGGSAAPSLLVQQVATWGWQLSVPGPMLAARACACAAYLTYGPPCSSPPQCARTARRGELGTHPEAAPGEAPTGLGCPQ